MIIIKIITPAIMDTISTLELFGNSLSRGNN